MEIVMEHSTHTVCANVFSCTGKQTLDADLVLPDYCGDIKRILHCFVEPQLNSVFANGDRLIAQGDHMIRLLYLNEQDQPDCLEQTLPLSVNCRCDEIPAQATLTATAAIEYVNCRALTSRKIQVDGTLTVRFQLEAKQELAFVGSTDSVETSVRQINTCSLSAIAEKTFDLSETIALSEAEPPAGSIVRVTGQPLLQTTEIAEDKLLIKGTLRLGVVVLSEDREIRSLSHALPISQVIEAPGVREGDTPDIRFSVYALYAQTKRDAAEEARLLDLACKVHVLVKTYRAQTLTAITDCYAVGCRLHPTFEAQPFPLLLPLRPQQTQAQRTLDTGIENGKLLHLSADTVQSDTVFRDGRLQLTHHVTITAMIRDEEGTLQYFEKTTELTEDYPVENEMHTPTFTSQAAVILEGARLSSNGSIQLDLSVQQTGLFFSMQTEQLLTGATADAPEKADEGQLILSFCKKGETLWSIGKRYQIPVESIRTENDLNEDTLTEDRMLLIACAT